LLADVAHPVADEESSELVSQPRSSVAFGVPFNDVNDAQKNRVSLNVAWQSELPFAEKLAAGASISSLARHSFDAESSLVIDVNVPDSAAREAAVARLFDYLDARAVPELREYAILSLIGVEVDLSEQSEVFVLGRQGVNYSEEQELQVLARLAPEELAPLVDAVVTDSGSGERVRAVVGPLKAEGTEAVRNLLAFAAPENRRRFAGGAGGRGTSVVASDETRLPATPESPDRAVARRGRVPEKRGPAPATSQPQTRVERAAPARPADAVVAESESDEGAPAVSEERKSITETVLRRVRRVAAKAAKPVEVAKADVVAPVTLILRFHTDTPAAVAPSQPQAQTPTSRPTSQPAQ
jgi:hypothetical protein